MTGMKTADWEARVARAAELATEYPASAQLLDFYAVVAGFQRGVYEAVSRWQTVDGERPLRARIELDLVAPFLPELLRIAEERGPVRLAEAAKALRAAGEGRWRELLMDHLSAEEPQDPVEGFFPRACIEPYAEHLAAQVTPRASGSAGACPVCAGRPLLAVLHPEGEGAKRFLLCSFCLTEWEFRRILCPVCGEENDPKLPVFSAQELPHVRIEGCDSCKHYLLSVDLSRHGHAQPLVDEIAAAPLDLWARQQGYRKIVPNLLGF